MASNAVLLENRPHIPESVSRAQLAIDRARHLRPRIATEFEDVGHIINLGLRAGVRLHFVPDHRREIPQGLDSLVGSLKSMEVLDLDWDSYGGMPLSDAAVMPAIMLAVEGLNRCHAPAVVLRPNGGLGLRWNNEDRHLTVDVEPNGKCVAFYEEGETEEEIDVPTDAAQIVRLVHQVCCVG